jgi:cellulose biosynthesis protein BcsQ
MKDTNKPLAGQRIGLFGRGGSGKSTCTVLLAKALAKAGYVVCVVDADSTNEGLAQAGRGQDPRFAPGLVGRHGVQRRSRDLPGG